MPSCTQTTACLMAGGKIALLIAAVLPALTPVAYAADESNPATFKPPFVYKQNHVHYDVNADGTYKEQDDLTVTVLTEQGVEWARQMPIGMPSMPVPMPDREIEVLAAYTLKKSGERIAVTHISSTAPGGPQMKILAFQSVVIGDTLVLSYTVTQKKPVLPGNFVLHQAFQKRMVFEDAVISITAPASLDLRTETSGIEPGQRTTAGGLQKWEWKYQNKSPVVPVPAQLQPFDHLHVSTFKDNDAEMAAMRKVAAAFAPQLQRMRGEGCPIFPGEPNEGPAGRQRVASEVFSLFWSMEDAFKQRVHDWSMPTCLFDDGQPVLIALADGYDEVFSSERDWSKSLARVQYLRKKYPEEAFAALAEAEYWNAYAWNARGGGYASSVADDGWKLFHERLQKAEQVLLDTKPYSSQLPDWYRLMVNVQTALGRPEDERDRVFLEGVKRYPAYHMIYFTMQLGLTPKWGGTWRTVDNLVNWSVEHTKAVEGSSMYARLYWSISADPQVNIFKDTFASWPKMKRGFEDLAERHPNSKWNLNNFARFACLAGDKQTFLKLRGQMGKDVIDAAWPENTSLDLCETKFGYAE